MSNTRFATAVHILTILARSGPGWISSEWLAGSICMNPAMVRKELAALRDAGLVTGRKGKDGGSRLRKSGDLISLADIYRAVKNAEVLGRKNRNPSPQCPVGKSINSKLGQLYAETDQLVIDALENRTLSDFASQFD